LNNKELARLHQLIKDSTADNVKIRTKAGNKLRKLGPEAVPTLITLLQNEPDQKIRLEIESTLGYIKDDSALEPLINLARVQKKSGEVDWRLVTTLAKFGGDDVFECLIDLLSIGNNTWVIHEIGELGDRRAIPYLFEAWEEAQDDYVKSCLILALGELGEKKVIPQLIELLEDEDENTRSDAAWRLGDLGDRQAVIPLIKALNVGEQVFGNHNMILALVKLGDTRALEPLINALLTAAGNDDRDTAAYALGVLGDKRAIEPLLEVLASTEEHVEEYPTWRTLLDIQGSALDALVKLEYEGSVDVIKDFLATHKKDFKPFFYDVEMDAEVALYKLGEKEILNSLIGKLSARKPKVRATAISHLYKLGVEELIIDRIIEMVNDPNQEVRRTATSALGTFKDNRVLTVLEQTTITGKTFWDKQEAWKAIKARRARENSEK
jgi:HEAT repeat protein